MAENKWNFPGKAGLLPNEKLPDPLLGPGGRRIGSPAEWPAQREYLKAMLEHYLYGHCPLPPRHTRGKTVFSKLIRGGTAVRELVNISCGPDNQIQFEVKITRPNKPGKFPVFVMNDVDRPVSARNGPGDTAEDRLREVPAEEKIITRGYAIAQYRKDQLTPLLIGGNTSAGVGGGHFLLYPRFLQEPRGGDALYELAFPV